MIDYTDLDLIEDNMFLVGDTENRKDWLEAGPQYECYDLAIFLRNIAMAGALARVSPFDMVREFHAKVGQYDSLAPDISSDRTRNLRIRLIDEERKELGDALAADDVIEVADALADLLYVVIGSALQWGIPIERVFAEVHRSNMTKGDGPKRADGKILKGPNYSPPDLSFVAGYTLDANDKSR